MKKQPGSKNSDRRAKGSEDSTSSTTKKCDLAFDQTIDEMSDESFPASDPPSFTPVTGVGAEPNDLGGSHHDVAQEAHDAHDTHERDQEIKNSPAKQFEYGRKSEIATHHFDRSSKRLEKGNPDIGDVDLGVIDEKHPTQKEDNDPWTAPPDPENEY
jgi:hypothetical protein